MKVTVLVENSKGENNLSAAHGLSFLIEAGQFKMLFDLGPSAEIVKNAHEMNVDLADIDSVVLSHGHSDHVGGLRHFRIINDSAPVYMHKKSRSQFRYRFNRFVAIPVFNRGIHKQKQNLEPIVEITDTAKINPVSTLYCNFKRTGVMPPGNQGLEIKKNKWETDEFIHEVALLIQYEGKNILFTGCSHNGLKNIMESVKEKSGVNSFDYIFGGFHLYDPIRRSFDDGEYFTEFREYLNVQKSRFYTGHCTGQDALRLLESIHGNKVEGLHTGKIIEINP